MREDGRGKREEGRGKGEEGRGKGEEGRGKREGGRGKGDRGNVWNGLDSQNRDTNSARQRNYQTAQEKDVRDRKQDKD